METTYKQGKGFKPLAPTRLSDHSRKGKGTSKVEMLIIRQRQAAVVNL